MKRALIREGLPLALLAALLLALFLPHLLRGEVLTGYDLHNEMAPLRGWLEREWLAHGELPGWNRYLFCGYPNLSVHRSEVLYPPDVIFRWQPALAAYSWSAAGHLLLAALGAYACGRTMGLRPAGSFLAGLLFTMSFPYIGKFHPGHVTQIRCAAFIPWVMLCLELLARRRPLRLLLPLAALLALQGLAWSPDLFLYALYFYAAFLLLRLWPWRHRWRLAAGRFGIFLAAAALAFITLLPSLFTLRANMPDLVRAQAYPSPVFNRLGWHTGMLLLMPRLLGDPLQGTFAIPVAITPAGPRENWRPPGSGLDEYPYWEETIFCGVTGLLLALYGACRPGRQRWRWLILLAGAAVFALGDLIPVYRLFCLLPGLGRFRCPSRIMLLGMLLLALLAGRGFDCLRRRPAAWPAGLLALLVMLGVFLVAGAATVEGWLLPYYPLIPPDAIRLGGLFLGLTAVLIGLVWGALRRSTRWRFALLVIVLAELWFWCLPFITWTTPPPPPWWVPLVPQRVPPVRLNIAGFNGPDRVLDYGLESCDGRDPLRIQRYETWASGINRQLPPLLREMKPYLSDISLLAVDAEAYRAMAVGYMVLPWADAVGQARLLDGAPPAATEYLFAREEPPARARLFAPDGRRVLAGAIDWREYADERMALAVSCTEPARLVISTTYHGGWSATVDGELAELAAYRETFISLPLAAGGHRVALQYSLPGAWFPWWLARLWLWLLLAGALLTLWRGRPAVRQPGQ